MGSCRRFLLRMLATSSMLPLLCARRRTWTQHYLPSKAMEFAISYTCCSDRHKISNTALCECCHLDGRRCMHHILKSIPSVGQLCHLQIEIGFPLAFALLAMSSKA